MEWLLMIVLQNDQVIAGRSFSNQQQCEIVAQRNIAEINTMNAKIHREFASCGPVEIKTNLQTHNGKGWNFSGVSSYPYVSKETEQCRVNVIKTNTIPKTKNYYCIAG